MPFERLSICFFCSSSRSLSSEVAFMDDESKVCASKLFSILDMGKDIHDVIVFIVNFLAFNFATAIVRCRKRRTLLKVVRPTPPPWLLHAAACGILFDHRARDAKRRVISLSFGLQNWFS